MFVQVRKQCLDEFHLCESHSLNDEASIMGEKEERATRTRRLPRSEDLVSVKRRVQGFGDLLVINTIQETQSLEETRCMSGDCGPRQHGDVIWIKTSL